MSILNLFKSEKCAGCDAKLTEDFAVIRVKAQGQPVEIKICETCADFWDQSAEVLQKRGRKDDGSESV